MENKNDLYLNISIPQVQEEGKLDYKVATNMHPQFLVDLLTEFVKQLNIQQWQEQNKNAPTTSQGAELDSNTITDITAEPTLQA